jgi:hypothetical protein
MFQAHIKELFFRKRFSRLIFDKLDDDIKNDIYLKTAFLPTETHYSERAYCYMNDISDRPKCVVCNKLVVFPYWLMKSQQVYRTYCSNLCSNNAPDVQEKKKNAYQDRYGVSNPSKDPTVKAKKRATCETNYGGYGSKIIREKSKETIFRKYGVYRLIDIPAFRANLLSLLEKRKSIKTSKVATSFIESFIVKNDIDPERCMYGEHEFFLNHNYKNPRGIYFYDLVVFKTKDDKECKNKDAIVLILEYDGAYWHPDINKAITYGNEPFRKNYTATIRTRYRLALHKELVARRVTPNFIRITENPHIHLP